jgi:AcrR family transcriptional regulator
VRTKTAEQSEKILCGAARLFATHRFHEARMEDIAAAAEVGKGTLYRYFKDKEELYLALLDRASQGLTERMTAGMAAADGPRARLEAMVAAIIAFFDDNPFLLDLITHAEALQRPEGAFPWQEVRQANIERMHAILVEGEAAGEWSIRDHELSTLLFLASLRGVLRFARPPRPPDLARRIVEDFLHGADRRATEKPGVKGRPWAAQTA